MQRPSDLLTVTRMTAYERCPRQWGYIHVSGLRSAPAWVMVAGSAMDDTLTEHHAQRIRGANGLRGTALTDYYVHHYKERVSMESPVGDPDPDAIRDGTRLLPMYEKDISPQIEPLEVQKEVTYTIAGKQYLGHIDLTRRAADGRVVVSDHKFTSTTPRPDKAAKSLQLRAYDLAVNDPGHRVELINLVRLKREPKIVVTPHVVSEKDRQELLMKFSQTAALVDSMIFPQVDPTSWACSAQNCGFYRTVCRGREGGPLPIPGERGLGYE